MGDITSILPIAQDFERSLSSMANTKPTVTFHAEDVTVAKAGFLDQLSRESLYKPIRIILAATIPTAAGAAMVSVTTTSKTPSAIPISYAISVKTELLGALRAMEQQNARLPRAISGCVRRRWTSCYRCTEV